MAQRDCNGGELISAEEISTRDSKYSRCAIFRSTAALITRILMSFPVEVRRLANGEFEIVCTGCDCVITRVINERAIFFAGGEIGKHVCPSFSLDGALGD